MARDSRKLNVEALVDFLRTEGLVFTDGRNSWVLDCPICGKHKWAIKKTDGYSKCYHCDIEFRGWADYTIAKALKRDRKDLSRLFYGAVFTTSATEEVSENERWVDHWSEMTEEDVEVSEVRSWPPEILPGLSHYELDSELGAPGLEYLESRGVSLELAKKYGIKYDTANERVVFPIIIDGVLRGWQGRLIRKVAYIDKKTGRKKELPKALTEGEVGGKCLIFQDRLNGSSHGIIAEGPMDALKLDLCGGNTATMGKSVTKDQLDIYVKHYRLRKLYVGLDDDAGAEVERIARELSWYKDVKVFRLTSAPGREDLGEGTLEENLEMFRSARPIKTGQAFVFRPERIFRE
jgi:hypothetical protein